MAWEFRGPDPLYRQIATELRSRIERGVYQPGYAIPSNSALCEEFGVTHRTARMAVEILVEEGLLVGAVGRGMFVTDPDSRTPADSRE